MCSSLFDSPMIRSEEMTLVQLVERNDAARAIINELGEASLLHFRDMNKDLPSYKRAFTAELKKCDDAIKHAEENQGDIEVRDAIYAKAVF